MSSLRGRLTAAVMMPLVALALTFGGITCWMIYRTTSTTADRTLVSSATTLSRAIDAPVGARGEMLPLAVNLLHSRSTPRPIYSIHEGRHLVAGTDGLPLPPDYDPHPGAKMPWHEPTNFPRSYREAPLARSDRANDGVIQPAYLREAKVRGRAVRIATEIRVPHGSGPLVLIQTAEFLDDRKAFEQTYYLRVAGAGVLIVMIALLLFYGAITWGLGPFASLAAQIDDARRHARANVRVTLARGDPLEAWVLANAFNDLMARTERATQSLRQFTANASHQLRTPLTIVRVHADVLARYGPSTPQGATALADIVSAVDALDHLLSQLLALARMDEQSELLTQLHPFDLSRLAAALVTSRVTLPDAARMDIGYETAEPAIVALGDEMLAAEMIGNLLDNAIRYNRPDGEVTVRVLRRDGEPAVEIEDDGPGIAPADWEKVWERFYRAPGADGPAGSGLGLAIVRALGEKVGARTTLEVGAAGRGVRAVIVFQGEGAKTQEEPDEIFGSVAEMTAC
jgi:two-component system sensor histidine kinase TctE